MTPTGQMVQQAKANGFASVRHMLCDTEGEKPKELIMEDFDDIDSSNEDGDNNCSNEDGDNNCSDEDGDNISISNNNKSNEIDFQHNDINVVDYQSKVGYENYDVDTKNTIYNLMLEQNEKVTNNGNFSTSNGLDKPNHGEDGYLNSVEYVLKVIMWINFCWCTKSLN